MSSEEEPDLPVAAYEWRYVDWEDGHTVLRHDEPDRNSFDVELELVDELVKESDAEEAIQEAREEARRQERQKILDKIDKEIKSTKKAAENAGVQVHDLYGTTAITALENLQDELEEEAEA